MCTSTIIQELSGSIWGCLKSLRWLELHVALKVLLGLEPSPSNSRTSCTALALHICDMIPLELAEMTVLDPCAHYIHSGELVRAELKTEAAWCNIRKTLLLSIIDMTDLTVTLVPIYFPVQIVKVWLEHKALRKSPCLAKTILLLVSGVNSNWSTYQWIKLSCRPTAKSCAAWSWMLTDKRPYHGAHKMTIALGQGDCSQVIGWTHKLILKKLASEPTWDEPRNHRSRLDLFGKVLGFLQDGHLSSSHIDHPYTIKLYRYGDLQIIYILYTLLVNSP